MSESEYNPEGLELDDVFEQPVKCDNCGSWHELNDSYFFVEGYCECSSSCTHGLCEECFEMFDVGKGRGE